MNTTRIHVFGLALVYAAFGVAQEGEGDSPSSAEVINADYIKVCAANLAVDRYYYYDSSTPTHSLKLPVGVRSLRIEGCGAGGGGGNLTVNGYGGAGAPWRSYHLTCSEESGEGLQPFQIDCSQAIEVKVAPPAAAGKHGGNTQFGRFSFPGGTTAEKFHATVLPQTATRGGLSTTAGGSGTADEYPNPQAGQASAFARGGRARPIQQGQLNDAGGGGGAGLGEGGDGAYLTHGSNSGATDGGICAGGGGVNNNVDRPGKGGPGFLRVTYTDLNAYAQCAQSALLQDLDKLMSYENEASQREGE